MAALQYVQDYDGAYAPRYIDYCNAPVPCTDFTRVNWPDLLFPYIKQRGGVSGTQNAEGVYTCPSSPVTNTRVPQYNMVCDSSWQVPKSTNPLANWKGYVYHGTDSALYEPDVKEPANCLFMTETPKIRTPNSYGTADGHRVCPPFETNNITRITRHYDVAWYSHDDISMNDSDKRHNGGLDYLFFDGHVKWLRSEATVKPKNLWTLDSED